MDIRFLGIDWQNDFVDPSGSLYVTGADQDAIRFAVLIRRIKNKINGIHATLDSHQLVHIAHPIWWINSEGKHPDISEFYKGNPTIISASDVKNGTWTATKPSLQKYSLQYVETLEKNGRYPLCIWPPHCLIGSWGHGVYPAVFDAFTEWEQDFKKVDYRVKGSNPYTEHYSGVQADVPDPSDPHTMLDTSPGSLIDVLANADMIAITGQALSHCLANTVRDIANNFGDDNIKKMVLLQDCTSSVTGFENLGNDFINEMTIRGMQVTTSDKFLV